MASDAESFVFFVMPLGRSTCCSASWLENFCLELCTCQSLLICTVDQANPDFLDQAGPEFYDAEFVAKQAPYGNDFTLTQEVCIRSGRLIYYNSSKEQLPSAKPGRLLTRLDTDFSQPSSASTSPDHSLVHNYYRSQGENIQFAERMPGQHNFTGVVPAHAFNGHHQLPKLNDAMPTSGSVRNLNQKQTGALPAIPTSPPAQDDGAANGFGGQSVKSLLTRNGHLSNAEEEELIKELLYILPFIDERRLASMRNEISDYDPHQRKLIDASALQRIFMTSFKQMPQQVQQRLFRLFATDPKKPRLINYDGLIDYLLTVKPYADSCNPANKQETASPANGSMAQSPFYKRGDAKLILEIELAMKENNLYEIDVEGIRQAMNLVDRQHTGTLSEPEIEDILKSFGLMEVFKPCFKNLLSRCDLNGENRYDWTTLMRFFEKAQPVIDTAESAPAPKPKKDLMESQLGFPMIASVGATGSFQRVKPPRTNFQTTFGAFSAPEKKIEETRQEMQALELQRKKIEESLARTDKTFTHKNKDALIAATSSNGSELPALFRQRAVTLNESQNVVATKGARRPRSAEKLIEELKKLDSQNYGFIPLAKARTMIQQFNDLHQLGLNSRFINSALSLCANVSESHVNLRELINYLNAVMANNALTP